MFFLFQQLHKYLFETNLTSNILNLLFKFKYNVIIYEKKNNFINLYYIDAIKKLNLSKL